MNKPYYLIQRKNRNIQVTFAHLPGQVFSTGTRDLKDAVIFAEQMMERDWRLANKHVGSITFRRFAKNFFTKADPRGVRERNTLRNRFFEESYYSDHQARLDNYIMPTFGEYSLTEISHNMVDQWFIGLHSVKTGKPLSSNSRNKILKCFQIIMEEAWREELIRENPVKGIQMILENDLHPRQAFTPEELKRLFPENPVELLKIWDGVLWSTYFLIMRDTGWRPGEVLGLKKNCYYPELGGIYTESSVVEGEYKQSIKTTYSGQKYKVGILTDTTKGFLEQLINNTEGEFLFKTKRGFYTNAGANKHLALSAERAGVALKGRTQYCLRHTFETALAGKVDNQVLLELMAHTNFRPEYDHRTPEDILRLLQPVKPLLETRGGKTDET